MQQAAALLFVTLLGFAAAQAPAQAPSGGLDGITTALTCPVGGTPVFLPADPANINTTYTAAITWLAITQQPGFVAPPAPCNAANFTDASTVESACSTPFADGFVVITQFRVVLTCGAQATVQANLYVGANSQDGQVLLRNYNAEPWQNLPSPPLPSPVVAPSPKIAPSPAPGASPAIQVPTNETFDMSCPAVVNAESGFFAAPLTDENTLITAEQTYDAIIASGKYPGVPASCDVNNATGGAVTEACAKTVSGGFIAILQFSVTLQCGISANVSANVFVYNTTGMVYLRNYTIGPWTNLPPSPSFPSPSPRPPRTCPFGVPLCRVYVEDTVCCQQQGLVTPKNYAEIRLVCSEFAPPPAESCWTISGPTNASVISTDFGTYFEGRRYLVNWTADSNYTGAVRIGLNQTAPECALPLAQGPCLFNNVVYNTAVQTNDTLINAIPDTGVYFSYLPNARDLVYLDNLAWMNTQDNSTGCLMQTPNMIPKDFYVRGWVNFTQGVQASCSSASGVTCTAVQAPAPAPAAAANVSGRRRRLIN